MTDMFSAIAKDEDDRSEATGNGRAKIAAVARAKRKFSSFVGSGPDREDKISFIQSDILATVVAACEEHGVTERARIQSVLNDVMASLRSAKSEEEEAEEELDNEYEERLKREAASKTAWNFDKKKDSDKDSDDDSDDDSDSDSNDKPKGEKDDDKKESSVHVAEVPTGDTYAQETVDLPTATADGSTTGLADKGSPEIDESQVPEGGLDPIDVPSNAHKQEMQEIRPKDFEEKLKEFDPAQSPVHDQVDPSKAIGEEQVGDRTDTFGTPEGQASAVTSAAVPTSLWRVETGE